MFCAATTCYSYPHTPWENREISAVNHIDGQSSAAMKHDRTAAHVLHETCSVLSAF